MAATWPAAIKVLPKTGDIETASPLICGLRGLCPRCGKGRLFQGYLEMAPRCSVCDLDFKTFDTADGPAFFVMSFVGFIVVGLAVWLEFTFSPPLWLNLSILCFVTVALSLLLMRPSKGLLAALQYHHRAAEGRIEK